MKKIREFLHKYRHAWLLSYALDGAFKLNQLGIPAVAGDIWEAQAAYAFNLGPEDVVLIISNSGS